ncbi:MAG: septum formation protein Maf [Clostridia bacterium]|nr:septum formation protein Maf [Clostridia bacterium]
MRVILASKSPRRRELLGKIIDNFEIITAETDEALPPSLHPSEGVRILAIRKGAAVRDTVGDEALIISSDTLVEIDGEPLGKPTDEACAAAMLTRLSGRGHNVHTGVAIHYKGKVFSGTHTSRVYFRKISDREIQDYIATGEPMDKAGSYGIQGEGGKFVKRFDGEFDSIMGLSVSLTRELMEKAVGGEV